MPIGYGFRGFVRFCALLGAVLLCAGCAKPASPAAPDKTAAPAATSVPAVTASPTPTVQPTASPTPTPVPVEITAFVPDAYGKQLVRVRTAIAEDTPLALIDELVRLGALPDVDYGRAPYFEVGDSYVKGKGNKRIACVVARLDVSERFLGALGDMTRDEELLCLQGFANTFLTHYNAETFMLTINGDKLDTSVRDYERGLTFDQYAKTADED